MAGVHENDFSVPTVTPAAGDYITILDASNGFTPAKATVANVGALGTSASTTVASNDRVRLQDVSAANAETYDTVQHVIDAGLLAGVATGSIATLQGYPSGVADTNTKIVFTDDAITVTAGGVEAVRIVEDTQDAITLNNGATDWDFAAKKLTSGTWLNYDGGTDALTTGAATVDITAHDASTAGLKLGGTLVTATAQEINGFLDNSARYVAAGSTLAVTAASHNGKTIKLDTLTGSVCTLPAATGSGARFRFVISVIATSNSHVIKVTGDDTMIGLISVLSDGSDNAIGFKASGTDDTITLNRTTTGSTALGEWIEVEDFAADLYLVRGMTAATGSEATPFSATV